MINNIIIYYNSKSWSYLFKIKSSYIYLTATVIAAFSLCSLRSAAAWSSRLLAPLSHSRTPSSQPKRALLCRYKAALLSCAFAFSSLIHWLIDLCTMILLFSYSLLIVRSSFFTNKSCCYYFICPQPPLFCSLLWEKEKESQSSAKPKCKCSFTPYICWVYCSERNERLKK